MRDIKFRVWSNRDKIWLNHCAVIDCGGKVGSHFVEVTAENKIIEHCPSIDHLEPIIQQYTGLKDRNGKEIYEGDIIKYSKLDYRVVWYDWLCRYRIECPKYVTYKIIANEDFTDRIAQCSEIVGNIFETPELLK